MRAQRPRDWENDLGELDYFNENDLTDAVAELAPQFDLLVSLASAPGFAGWLRCHFNPDGKYLVLCRRYYPARLTNLLMDHSHAFLADFGLQSLH
jgi:hypothetical protein